MMVWPVTRHDGWFADLSVHGLGALVTVMGTVVWLRGQARVGKLVTFIGITYYIQDLRVSEDAFVFAVGFCLAYLWYGGLAHLALALPYGKAGVLHLSGGIGQPLEVVQLADKSLPSSGDRGTRRFRSRDRPQRNGEPNKLWAGLLIAGGSVSVCE
jgi:hypothetical protein